MSKSNVSSSFPLIPFTECAFLAINVPVLPFAGPISPVNSEMCGDSSTMINALRLGWSDIPVRVVISPLNLRAPKVPTTWSGHGRTSSDIGGVLTVFFTMAAKCDKGRPRVYGICNVFSLGLLSCHMGCQQDRMD